MTFKNIILAAFLTGSLVAQAATLSVGATGFTYTTIQAAVTAAVTGDIVEVHAGTYREVVTISKTGITLRAFAGDVVTIDGCDLLTTWISDGSGVYHTTMAWDVTASEQSNQIFVDGKMLNLARYPKLTIKDANGYYDLINITENAKASNVTNLTNVSLGTDIYSFNKTALFPTAAVAAMWNGAQIWINLSSGRSWGLDGQGWTGLVSSTTTGSVSATGCGGHGISDQPWGLGATQEFYVFNPTAANVTANGGVTALLAAGEWWKNGTTLYVKLPNGSAPSATGAGTNVVKAKKRVYSIVPSSAAGLASTTIKGFKLFATSITTDNASPTRTSALTTATGNVIDGLDVKYVTHFTDQTGDMQMHWSGQSGVVVSGKNNVIKNCNFQFSAASAITVIGDNNHVLNNNMLDMNYNVSEAGAINTGKLTTACTNSEIAYNTITNVCEQACNMRQFSNTSVLSPAMSRFHHNVITNFMIRNYDSGAFDCFGNDKRSTRIDHNIISNATNPLAVGIYLDFAGGAIIDHNLFYNVDRPIQVNQDGSAALGAWVPVKIYNNTAMGSSSLGIVAGVGGFGRYFDVRNNIATGSIAAAGAGAIVSNNLASATTTLFTASASNDYSLKSTSTTAINTGVMVPYIQDVTDGKVDLGCYEYGVPKWTAGYGTMQAEFALVDSVISIPATGLVKSYSVKVTAIDYAGFTGTSVALSLGTLPTGVTASMSASTVAIGGFITLTITTDATCTKSGILTLTGTSAGLTFVRSYRFVAIPTPTSISITAPPTTASLQTVNSFYTFVATVYDQDGNALSPQPSINWSAVGGSINTNGKYVVTALSNPASVTATVGGVTKTLTFKTPYAVVSAIEELTNDLLKVYPNPAQSEVTVDFPSQGGNVSLSLVDFTGRMVYNRQADSAEKQSIDLSSFSTGIYLLVAKQGDVVLTKKLVVRK